MKKVLIAILFCFILAGCHYKQKNKYIESIIEKKENCLVGITYPVTNIKKLDNELKKYIKNSYEYINTNTKELNIDYTYNEISERYINITLKRTILTDNNSYDIATYIYDKKNDNFLNLASIISKDSYQTINKIIEKNNLPISKYEKAVFDENYIYLYINIDDDIKTVNIPIHDTEILIDLPITNINTKEITDKIPKTKTIDPYKPVVALTFDDGPSKYTKAILDILKENDANATFFILGNKVKYYSETINIALENGNEIGNHSYDHKSLDNLTINEILSEINKTQDIIYEYTNYTPKYLRPTYGNTSKRLKDNTPLEIILWNVDPEDWKYKNSKTIANKVLKKTKDESVILMHDTKERTLNALKIIIPQLKQQGYQFVTISELKQVQKIRKNLGIKNE